MNFETKKVVPKLVCGRETATAFLIADDIAITAMHAIIDFFNSNKPIKLFFNIDNQLNEIYAEPIIYDEECKKQQIIALKLKNKVEGIKPIKCMYFKFNTHLLCKTYGYPAARSEEGTFINLQVKNEEYAENYRQLNSQWNIDLSKDDDIKDYSGVSGAPLILNNRPVAVILNQVSEDDEASRLSAVSLYLYKEYFSSIGVNIIEKNNESYYKSYIAMLQDELNQHLENTILRKLNRQYNNERGLGFNFKLTTDNRQYENLESYIELLSIEESAIILSEPGGGKTYLLSMLAKEIIENPVTEKNRIPIILKARKWTRSFSSIVEGILKELKYTIPNVDEKQVEQDLIEGKFLILVDGLDEVTNSEDLLIDELINISKIKSARILVTCRKENYHNQFYNRFSEYIIDELNEEMISEYMSKSLDLPSWKILHNMDSNLNSIIKNPLFLFMTVSILKITGYTDLPKNKAELYDTYIKYLIDERNYQKSIVTQYKIDLATKELILAEYAKQTYNGFATRIEFSDSVCKFLARDKVEIVKKELLDAGLIIEDKGDIIFFHQSFHEYFFALNISRQSDDELIEFIKKYNSNDKYYEVFIYLAGLLKKDNRQTIFLDYLEDKNLFLYRRCLEARFSFNNQLKETWSKKYTYNYFEQVLNSYEKIIDNHFKFIKMYFYPWCLIKKNKVRESIKVIIEGSMDFERPAIYFRFLLASNESKEIDNVALKDFISAPKMYTQDSKGNEVSIPIISFKGRNHWYLDLKSIGMGIDSPREVALYSIKKQLFDILDKKEIFDIEPVEMIVTQIEEALQTLPAKRFYIEEKQKGIRLSLYKYSIDQIIDLFLRKDILQYANTLNNDRSEEIMYMVISLCRLKEMNIDIKQYLLPNPDIELDQLNKKNLKIWDRWSDKQLCKLITILHEHYQNSYRFLVENYIPSLKEFLPFYAMGPIKFNISIYRDEDFGGGVETTWEPVTDISMSKPSIVLVQNRNDQNDFKYDEKYYKKTDEELSKLGRKILPFYTRESSAVSLYIRDNKKLRNKVYGQLKKDLSYVIGDLK